MGESEPDLSALDAAAAQWPKKKKAQVRRAWPKIKAMLAAGHTLKEAHAAIVRARIRIAYPHFTAYVKQIRLEEAPQGVAINRVSTTKLTEKPPARDAGKEGPLSMAEQVEIRKRQQRLLDHVPYVPTQVTDPNKFD